MTETVAPPKQAGSLPRTPYVGLVPYGEEDADFFFGRDEEKQIVAGNLRASRLTILYGPSGVGKTSLLRAGVVHDLREQVRENAARQPERAPFAICVFQGWQDDPLSALAEAIRRSAVEALPGEEIPPWQPGEPLVETLRAWTERVRTLLVVLDQFEDYFRYHPDEDGEGTFAAEFPRTINDPNLRVNFLVSIREDAWAKLDRFEGRIPRLFANYVRVEHLSRGAAREAIEGPVRQWNRAQPRDAEPYTIDPELVEAVIDAAAAGQLAAGEGTEAALLDAASGEAIEAPFLQLVMERLWRATVEVGSRELTRARLDELGGAQRIVENHLLEALGGLTRAEQAVVADVFRFLATRSKTKVTQSVTDLAEWTKHDKSDVSAVLDKLCSAESGRILRPVPSPLGESEGMRYELFHDVLAEPILDWRRRHEQERARREARGRFARIGGVLLSLIVIFAALGIWALLQRGEARQATNRAASLALASIAKDQIRSDPDKALLLGLEANRAGSTAQATSVMMSALQHARRPGMRAILHTGEKVARSIAFGSDGRTLAVAYGDQAVLWDVSTGKAIGPPLRGAIEQIVFSPDGKMLVSAAESGGVQLWNARSHQRLGKPLPLASPVAFSPNGHLLAANGNTGIEVWDVVARRRHRHLRTGGATALAFAPDGTTLVAGYPNAGIGGWELWNVASGKLLTGRLGQTLNGVGAVAVSPDGHRIVVSKSIGSLEILDLPERKLQTLRRILPWFLTLPAFSPDGQILAAANNRGAATVLLFDAHTLERVGALSGHTATINSLAFSPDGRTIASASTDGTVRLWDRDVHGQLPQALRGHTGLVSSVAISADGHTLASGSLDGTVRLWDLRAPEPRGQVLDGHMGRIWSVAFSPDGRTLAAGGYKAVQLWDVRTRRLIGTPFRGHTGRVLSVAFSPDGRMLATAGSDGTVRFWDPVARKQLEPPLRVHYEVRSIAFSPDGRRFATGLPTEGARLWDTGSRRALGSLLAAGYGLEGLAFSPDGRSLAAVRYDGVALWDTRTHKPLVRPLRAESEFSGTAVTFSQDGRILVIAHNSELTLWDVERRVVLGDPLPGGASSLAFTPDGRTLVAAPKSKEVLLFRDVRWRNFAELRAQVCSLVFGNLAKSEWEELAPGVAYRTTCPS